MHAAIRALPLLFLATSPLSADDGASAPEPARPVSPQAVYRDTAMGGAMFNLSDAFEVVLRP